MISNMPIYRAKKIDSDEYVEGYYSPAYYIHHYIITHLGVDTKIDVVYRMSTDIHKIDPTTLAIHFPDMLDSQGNKVFASLQEDGKGGDIIGFSYGIPFVKVEAPVKYKNSRIDVLTKGHKPDICHLYELEKEIDEYEYLHKLKKDLDRNTFK